MTTHQVGGAQQRSSEPNPRPVRPSQDKGSQDLSDMEIPTFIRRQMD
jgi:hypothetical protein